MQNINYSSVAELKSWLSEFKDRFTEDSDIEHIEKIEDILGMLLETKKNSPEQKASAPSKAASGTSASESYVKEYIRLFDLIIDTGITLNDPVEYFELRNAASEAKEKFSHPMNNPEKVIADAAKTLDEKGREYKKAMYSCSAFDGTAIDRIRAVNSLQNLLMLMKTGVSSLANTTDGNNYLLIDKVVQSILAEGMKSEPELYKQDFFDERKLFRAEKDLENAKPFVQKYKKAVAIKDRKTMISMTDEAVLKLLCKTLRITPKQILEYSKEYDDITVR